MPRHDSARHAWWQLVKQLALHKRALGLLVLWSSLGALPILLQGRLVTLAVDSGFHNGRPWQGVAWLALALAAFGAGALTTRNTFKALSGIVEPMRDRLVRSVVSAEMARAVARPGRLDSSAVVRLVGQVEVARDLVGGLLMTALNLVFTSAAVAFGLFSMAPLLGALITVPIGFALLLVAVLMPALYVRQRAVTTAEEQVSAVTTLAVEGTRDAIACGAQTRIEGNVLERIEEQAAQERSLARAHGLRTAVMAIGVHCPLVALIAGARQLSSHGVTPGELLGAGTYILFGIGPALRKFVATTGSSGLRLAVVLEKLTALSEPPTVACLPAGTPRGHDLVLRQLSFGYGPHVPVIDGLDLTVPHGSHVAVVGPSGIGKSTLADLISGVLTPDAGAVLLGGVPVDRLPDESRRRHLTVLPQTPYVFAGTLRENLTYLAHGAATAELDASIGRLGMESLVDRIGGYDSPVDPQRLSTGERQLIALARVDLLSTPVVVLDEATSGLDAAQAAQVEDALHARGRTLIVIAHRISSALRADTIVVMDGRCADAGTHDELVTRSPLYADLVGHWHGPAATPPTPVLNR